MCQLLADYYICRYLASRCALHCDAHEECLPLHSTHFLEPHPKQCTLAAYLRTRGEVGVSKQTSLNTSAVLENRFGPASRGRDIQ